MDPLSGLVDRIFEPYVRGTATDKPGLGLGLAAVKRFAETHGGRVGVRSEPGAGSAFWFGLPRATSAVAMLAPEAGAAVPK